MRLCKDLLEEVEDYGKEKTMKVFQTSTVSIYMTLEVMRERRTKVTNNGLDWCLTRHVSLIMCLR